jgi:hypothetical protein
MVFGTFATNGVPADLNMKKRTPRNERRVRRRRPPNMARGRLKESIRAFARTKEPKAMLALSTQSYSAEPVVELIEVAHHRP